MIPEIGILIAAYVITRMVDLFGIQAELLGGGTPMPKFRAMLSLLIIILLIVTILVAGGVAFDLFERATSGRAGTLDLTR